MHQVLYSKQLPIVFSYSQCSLERVENLVRPDIAVCIDVSAVARRPSERLCGALHLQ